jgi:hypothetical protein
MSAEQTALERETQNSKFDYKAPEENRKVWKPKEWSGKAFQGVSAFDFAMQQKQREKERKEKNAADKAQMYKYQGTGQDDAIMVNRKEQHDREKASKEKARETKTNLKDVNIMETAETNSRKEQFAQAVGFKQTQRDTRNNVSAVQYSSSKAM